MAAADPNNNLALMDVVNASTGFGDLLRKQHRTEAALASYKKVADAAERLNSDGAHVFANIDAGIQAHQRMGVTLVDLGRLDEAMEHFQKAGAYLAASEKLNPGLSRNLQRKAEIDAGRAEAYSRQGNWKEAIAAFSSALAIFDSQRKRDPKNETLLNEQPELYAKLADCY